MPPLSFAALIYGAGARVKRAAGKCSGKTEIRNLSISEFYTGAFRYTFASLRLPRGLAPGRRLNDRSLSRRNEVEPYRSVDTRVKRAAGKCGSITEIRNLSINEFYTGAFRYTFASLRLPRGLAPGRLLNDRSLSRRNEVEPYQLAPPVAALTGQAVAKRWGSETIQQIIGGKKLTMVR